MLSSMQLLATKDWFQREPSLAKLPDIASPFEVTADTSHTLNQVALSFSSIRTYRDWLLSSRCLQSLSFETDECSCCNGAVSRNLYATVWAIALISSAAVAEVPTQDPPTIAHLYECCIIKM